MGAKVRTAAGMPAASATLGGWLRKSRPDRRKKHQANRTRACG